MKIDLHCHFNPPTYLREIRKAGYTDQDIARSGAPAWDSEARIAVMDELGIDVQVLSTQVPGQFFPRTPLTKELARESNDFLAEVCAADKGRFLGLISVALGDVKAAIEEIHRMLGLSGSSCAGRRDGTNERSS